MAGLTLTYLLYRLEQQSKSAKETAQAASESSLASQQIALPTISVPTITPSPVDVGNQSQAQAIDPRLESMLTSILSQDNSSVTSQSSPIAAITELPFPTATQIPPVVVPPVDHFDFGSNVPTTIFQSPTSSSYSNTISWNGLHTNLAKGASLGV